MICVRQFAGVLSVGAERRSPMSALVRVTVAALLAMLIVGSSSVRAETRNYVTVVMEMPGATPFANVRYEIIDRGPATSAVHRRELPSYDESLHAMALLTRQEAASVFAALRRNDAMSLVDRVETPRLAAATWRVELVLGGKPHTFRVTDPANQMDRRYYRIISAVRGMVKRFAGELPFRNVFFQTSKIGYLNILSVPVAKVYVDGFETRLETPLYAYEVSSGEHVIRLKTEDGRYDRSYKVRVGPGGSTRLAVDLR